MNPSLTRRMFVPFAAAFGGALALAGAGLAAHRFLSGGDSDASEQAAAAPSEAPSLAIEGHAVTAYERPNLMQGALRVSADQYPAQVAAYTWPQDLSQISNSEDFGWIANDLVMSSCLVENGFAVSLNKGPAYSRNAEFFSRYQYNELYYYPNFVTTDSMMHTYHLYFAHLLKTCERNYLSSTLREVSNLMLDASLEQLNTLMGLEWESAAQRNVAFFAVGSSLLDHSTSVPSAVLDDVERELSLISGAKGACNSPVMGSMLDYSEFKPRGYYAGDETLERYFRAMMWYGTAPFLQEDESLDRSAALITIALQGDVLEKWEACYAVTSFFAGNSDDLGWYEYRPIVDEVYGENATAQDLVNGGDAAWQLFHAYTAAMPAPLLNPILIDDGEDDLDLGKSFRFMGQRFSLDVMVLQSLVYKKLPAGVTGGKRMLPDALDVPVAMGSDVALAIMEDEGVTAEYESYVLQVETLREGISELPEETWRSNLYNQWLHVLQPLLEEKREGWPAFMQSEAWSRKGLVTYLGSYTELKHDTILYNKSERVHGDGPPNERDDRGYVEPEPVLYGRLAELCRATREGLARYNMIGSEDASNMQLLEELASRLTTIAGKELSGASLSAGEYDLIRTYGTQLEHFWYEVYKDEADSNYFDAGEFPAAIVVDVATDPNGRVLELGTGNPSTIYVIVNVEGSTRIACGACYSFYQFEQPLAERLTDQEWREMQGISTNASGSIHGPTHDVVEWSWGFTSH